MPLPFRIPPVQAPYPAAVAPTLAAMMPPGMEPLVLFRTVARNPRVLDRLRGGHLLDKGSISVRTREIVILRATARCGAEYEWGVHVALFAGKAALSPENTAATAHAASDAACWTPAESALIAAVDALHDTATLDQETYGRLSAHFDDAQIVEILALAGQYRMVSYLVNALALPAEPGAPGFPAG